MSRFAAFVAAMLFSVSALAVPIPVHNTGVNSSDTLVAMGASTAFWTLLAKPGGASEAIGSTPFRFHHPAYSPDTATAAWVAPAASGSASASGVYVYRMLVDLTGFDLSTVSIAGLFSTDNSGFIRVNGGPSAASVGSATFGSPTAFSLTSGFVSGMNSIELGVNNEGNPTAFFVQFSSANGTFVPEPATLALIGLGLAGLGFRLRKKA